MRLNAPLAAIATTVLALPIFVTQSDAQEPSPAVTLTVEPDQLQVTAGRPCLPAPPLSIGMTNTSEEALYADTFVRADNPLTLTRGMFSSYVPGDAEVTAPVTVSAPHGTKPGDYEVTLELGQQRWKPEELRVPVEVTAPPEKTPGTNLLLGEQADPSSTYVTSSTEFSPCGGVDGDRTWSPTTAWNSAGHGDFPDTYTVTLPEPQKMNRVDLYTSTSPDRYGLRDWDVQAKTGDGRWQTVAQVRDNTLRHVSSTFSTIEAAAVRAVGLASNRNDYSRIAELEAYYEN